MTDSKENKPKKTDYFTWKYKRSDLFFGVSAFLMLLLNAVALINLPTNIKYSSEIGLLIFTIFINMAVYVFLLFGLEPEKVKDYVYKDELEGGEEQ